MKKSNKTGSVLLDKQVSESESDGEHQHDNQTKNSIENEEIDEKSDVESNPEEVTTSTDEKQKPKTRKKGIIYIGSIPQHMNVAICREFMEPFGEVGRIFLQPDKKGSMFITCMILIQYILIINITFNYSDKKS